MESKEPWFPLRRHPLSRQPLSGRVNSGGISQTASLCQCAQVMTEKRDVERPLGVSRSAKIGRERKIGFKMAGVSIRGVLWMRKETPVRSSYMRDYRSDELCMNGAT